MEATRSIRILSLAHRPSIVAAILGTLLVRQCFCCPPYCDCLTHENATLCKHRLLNSVPAEIPHFSYFLDLSNNQIKSVRQGAFYHLRDLQELDVSYNQISRVEPGAFGGLPNLRILLVHHNQLKLLPPGVFSGMPGLTWLDVRANHLVIMLDQTFRGLKELRHLEVGDNPLLFISPTAFLGMPRLQRLGMDKTKLGNVPSQAIASLPQLSELRLGGVTSATLRDFTFSEMSSLRVLNIDGCPALATLGPHSLNRLNLTSLSVTNCNLSSVPEKALGSQVHLRRLDLSHNPIRNLSQESFQALGRLEELRLSGGKLNYIPARAFNSLDRLRVLDLSDNPIQWVDIDSFPTPGVFETLLLSGTNLSCDCRLCWLLHHKIQFGGRPPVCTAPASLKGMVIPSHSQLLCPQLFTCQPARIVLQGPRELRVQEGDRLTISCQSYGVPQPSTQWVLPQVPWTMDTKSAEPDILDKRSQQHVRESWQLNISQPKRNAGQLEGSRITVMPGGTLRFLPVQTQDAGDYLCLASNLAGNDSAWIHLEVTAYNRSASTMLHSHILVVITAGGVLPFISSVTLCFIFIFLWSRGRGNIKHTAHIDYIPRTSRGTSSSEDNKFTMKLI